MSLLSCCMCHQLWQATTMAVKNAVLGQDKKSFSSDPVWRKGRELKYGNLVFFGHLHLSLSLSQLHAYPCLSPVTKQDALNYTRTLPSPFLRPLSVFYPFSHNCSFACCATTVAADRATNIKFEINKSKQFSRSGDMRGKSGRGWFHERLLESRRTDRSCKIGR